MHILNSVSWDITNGNYLLLTELLKISLQVPSYWQTTLKCQQQIKFVFLLPKLLPFSEERRSHRNPKQDNFLFCPSLSFFALFSPFFFFRTISKELTFTYFWQLHCYAAPTFSCLCSGLACAKAISLKLCNGVLDQSWAKGLLILSQPQLRVNVLKVTGHPAFPKLTRDMRGTTWQQDLGWLGEQTETPTLGYTLFHWDCSHLLSPQDW